MDLLDSEVASIEKIREYEQEIRDSLDERLKEEIASELSVSIFDTQRNDKALKHRAELERQAEEAKLQSQETELDYLAPVLAQIVDKGEKITRAQAFKIRETALVDLKQRLVEKANLIQARFEKETSELQKKQAWYQQNQVSLRKADEQQYLNYCSEAMFRIHILELRLNRHKEMAPMKYMALENTLRNDPRLSEYFM